MARCGSVVAPRGCKAAGSDLDRRSERCRSVAVSPGKVRRHCCEIPGTDARNFLQDRQLDVFG